MKMPVSPPPKGRQRVRHFLTWWAVITLMLATLIGAFGAGSLLLGYVGWIALDPAQSFHSPWHPVVAVVMGLFTSLGSAWLFGYGVIILRGVVRASRTLAHQSAASQPTS